MSLQYWPSVRPQGFDILIIFEFSFTVLRIFFHHRFYSHIEIVFICLIVVIFFFFHCLLLLHLLFIRVTIVSCVVYYRHVIIIIFFFVILLCILLLLFVLNIIAFYGKSIDCNLIFLIVLHFGKRSLPIQQSLCHRRLDVHSLLCIHCDILFLFFRFIHIFTVFLVIICIASLAIFDLLHYLDHHLMIPLIHTPQTHLIYLLLVALQQFEWFVIYRYRSRIDHRFDISQSMLRVAQQLMIAQNRANSKR
mmetsp:Transcript_1283/g.1970  ORF Transcript_1283/g.1970 Transcript_1283/m.1970 type:complete len:249 (+) Transcript_1283:90-836(+)